MATSSVTSSVSSYIDGLSSGLDTTSIIDALIQAERQPAVLMENDEAEKTNIVTALKSLQAKLISLSTTVSKLSQKASFNKYAVTVSDDTYLTATADGKVGVGSYDIQVLSVARNNQLASQGYADQSAALLGSGTITLSLGSGSSKTITIGSSNNSLLGVARAINDADAGVTASIINDGSKSNPYRLVLTGNKTGQTNKISVTSNLSGLNNLNFTTATFDAPEKLIRNSSSTSSVTLGSTATYTGSKNKQYTFTVAGTGAYTVGTDNVTLNWTDGTNSGSIIVTQADTEVALVGTGADGLKLSFSSGTLYGGDKFQVGTFAPTLQEAQDAQIAIGSTGSGGSPITVSSSTNTFTDVISGMTLTVKKATGTDDSVNLTTAVDSSKIKDLINEFIKQYNDVNTYINTQNSYNKDSEDNGVLFGEYTIQSLQASLRSLAGSRLTGMSSDYNQLASIGIRSDTSGNLAIKDSSALDDAITNHLDSLINVFASSGESTNDNISYSASTSKTKTGKAFSVNITAAATQGQFASAGISDPAATPITLTSSNNRLKISVDGLESNELVLSEKTYSTAEELVTELQDRIDNDTKIGSRGVKVTWVSTAEGMGQIVIKSSSYGSASKVNIVTSISNSAFQALGLSRGSSTTGRDVVGTINGEAATGKGQTLTGNDNNANTAGLKLLVTLTQSQLSSSDAEGTITLVKGVSSRLNDTVSSVTASGSGLMDRRIKAYEDQIQDLKDRVTEFDKRLEKRREDLKTKFTAMETAMSEYSSISSYLTSQLSQINSNWNYKSSS